MSAGPSRDQGTLDPGTAPGLPRSPAQGLLQQALSGCCLQGLVDWAVSPFEVVHVS